MHGARTHRAALAGALVAVAAVLGTVAGAGLGTGPAQAAAGATPGIVVRQGLCYQPVPGGCTGGTAHEFGAFLPATPSGPVPGVILVHGGAHKSGTEHDFSGEAGALAENGMAAFSINYRLDTPTTPGFPMQIQDVLAAVSYIRTHAATFGVDPSRLAMWGASAGADLTMRAELQAQQEDPSLRMSALVGWSGGYNYTVGASGAVGTRQVADVEQYVGCSNLTTPTCQQRLVTASAVTWVAPGDPPTLLANSTDFSNHCELTNPAQATDLAARLRAVGTPVTLALNGMCAHATAYHSVELSGTIAFLERHLGLPITAGYRMVASDGGVFSYGSALFLGSMGGQPLARPVVGTASTPTGGGYWEVASDGGIFAFGNAQFYGSMGGHPLNAPIVGMATTSTGGGYWEVASDGGVFAFGNATFQGSMGGHPLNAPIVAITATPTGDGYWEVASDGGIFAFGAAAFHGSMGGHPLNAPIVGMATTPTGDGYWEVASDGGVFAFGNAAFHGSMGGRPLNRPIVGLAATPTGVGYWEVASDGGVFAFGGAPFYGSAGSLSLDRPVVALSWT